MNDHSAGTFCNLASSPNLIKFVQNVGGGGGGGRERRSTNHVLRGNNRKVMGGMNGCCSTPPVEKFCFSPFLYLYLSLIAALWFVCEFVRWCRGIHRPRVWVYQLLITVSYCAVIPSVLLSCVACITLGLMRSQ